MRPAEAATKSEAEASAAAARLEAKGGTATAKVEAKAKKGATYFQRALDDQRLQQSLRAEARHRRDHPEEYDADGAPTLSPGGRRSLAHSPSRAGGSRRSVGGSPSPRKAGAIAISPGSGGVAPHGSPGSPGSSPGSPGGDAGGSPGLASLLGELGQNVRERVGGRTAWSVRLRHTRQAIDIRGFAAGVEMLQALESKAVRHAQRLPPPAVGLAVLAGAPCLQLRLHEWEVGRPARLHALLLELADDPKRRFVMGRERYTEDMIARADGGLADLEAQELRREDGTYSEELEHEVRRRRYDVATAAPELPLPTAAAAERAEALCWCLQRAGYEAHQAGLVLDALYTRETEALRRLFGHFDAEDGSEEGTVDRRRLCATLASLQEALPPAQWERLQRRLKATAATGGACGFNEFASLLRIVDLTGGGAGAGGSFAGAFGGGGPSPQRRGTTRDAAELALFKKVPPRNRKRYRALKANMERAGYQAREVLAVLRAMFVSQDDDAQLRAWRVFDPVGRGKLSIVEFKAALEICGDAIPAEAIEAEFRAIDADGSGWVEAKEFARLLGRIGELARGGPPPQLHSAGEGLLDKLHDEALLFATVDSGTRQALPLAYHPLAGRLIANMKLFGFTSAQAAAVVGALVLHDEAAAEAEAAAAEGADAVGLRAALQRQSAQMKWAWLLLGGADWALARPLAEDEAGDADSPDASASEEEPADSPDGGSGGGGGGGGGGGASDGGLRARCSHCSARRPRRRRRRRRKRRRRTPTASVLGGERRWRRRRPR